MSALVTYRRARIEDAGAIATIHATSWREHYRGAYADAFLDGPVFEDRRAVWTERLGFAAGDTATFVAELGAGVVGFAHLRLGADGATAALLDNIHVVSALRGQGIGTGLIGEVARFCLAEAAGSGLYLFVLAQNRAAQGFYRARGGEVAGEEWHTTPGGGPQVRVFRISWPDPSVLVLSR